MNNEVAALVILLAWVLRGAKFDLALVIFIYYAAYIAIDLTSFEWVLFQSAQALIDLSIILLCVILAFKSYNLAHPCFLYSIAVLSSLCVEVTHLLYGAGFNGLWYEVYEYRQEFSFPLDLIFAIVGSGKHGLITDAYLFILHILRYTRDIWHKLTD